MSLSEARRFADAPFAIHLAPEARLAKALWRLSASRDAEDGPRRLRISTEMVSRIWADSPTSHPA